MEELSIEVLIEAIKDMFNEKDLWPYKDLGNGLYELPGNVICNKKGLDEYLKEVKNTK